MEFLKKHYEKLILGIVLVGFLVGSVALVLQLQKSQDQVAEVVASAKKTKGNATNQVSSLDAALEAVKHPKKIVISGDHNLFNSVVWKKRSDGTLIKFDSEEKVLVRVLKINQLKYTIAFERQAGSSFFFAVTKESALKPADQKPQKIYASVQSPKTTYFNLISLQGPPEEPTGFQLELIDTKEKVLVTRTNPYVRVEGYAADLKYDVENKLFPGKRVNDIINFNEDDYKVIAITDNEVRVLANSNQKQTTLKYTASK